jgi:peptidoglycan/LPS O-acetylase OafA/YrhL
MPLIERFKYRPEIDGLRAIAVILVVLHHADIHCRGGYVGVDVFFVISGFLITSLIWKDLESGKFSFANFWERRARRIIPALIVVTLATLAAGCFILFPRDLEKLGHAAAAQTVFAANIHYFLDSGYFTGDSGEKPLLHTWSLAVEEQFYLIVPFLMFGLFRFPRLRSRKVMMGLILGCLAISLALSIREVSRNPSAAFYLIHSRAWELFVGSFLAFLPLPRVGGKSKVIFETCALSGLLLILLPAFLWYTRKMSFPGLAAVPPCLGAALFIWANGSMTTFVGRLLSRRPVVFIGLISYSLYLWHWPFLAYYNYLLLDRGQRDERIGLVILGFACAVLSWKYVETPFRKRKLGTTRTSIFAYSVAGSLAVLGLGLGFVALKGMPQRLSPEALEYVQYANDLSFATEVTVADAEAGKLIPIGSSDPKVKPTVLIWGDSHAMAAVPALDRYLKDKDLAGLVAAHSATAPVVDWYRPSQVGLDVDSHKFAEAVLRQVERQRISDVVLAACWRIYRSKFVF